MRTFRPLRPAVLRRQVLASPIRASSLMRHVPSQNVARIPVRHFSNQSSGLSGHSTASRDLQDENCVQILPDGLGLTLPQSFEVSNKQLLRKTLPFFWLRDNCRCPKCVNQDTLQRSVDNLKLPLEIKSTKAVANSSHVNVEWDDGHSSQYPWDFLAQYMYEDRLAANVSKKTHWGSGIKTHPPSVDYEPLMSSEKTVAQLTMDIMEHGFVLVNNVPYDDPNTTKEVLERIAFIRETHYGGFYDFKPDLAMADTAYTNLALDPHTDTTYFTEPAGLQAFHLLSHEPAVGEELAEGGETILVDGFNAAQLLREQDPRAYQVLSAYKLPWHASGNDGINIGPDQLYPVFQHYDGKLHRIRWNKDDRGVLPFDEQYTTQDWYEAASKFDQIVSSPDSQYVFQLKPGTVLIFDNWRVFHARTAFRGIRRMCGGYINRDDFVSRWMNTNFGAKESLRRVTGG